MVQVSKQLMEFVRPSEHSLFSPSGIDKWLNCPYSINKEKDIPEGPSKSYALEGTLAHKISEDLFFHRYEGKEKSAELMMASDEMMEGAEMHYACVTGWLENKEEIGEVLWYGIEKGIPIFPEHSCFGTADAVIVGTKGCATIDYKYGKKPVNAKTKQLFTYLLGVYRYLIDVPEDYKFHSIVVQPRTDYMPKCHEYTKAEFVPFEAQVYTAILASSQPGLEPVEGNHCFWCKARRTNDANLKCPAIAGKALKVAGEAFDKFFGDMNVEVGKDRASTELRDKALIKIMSLAPVLNSIAKEAMEEFQFRIDKGEQIDGIRPIATMGNRKWKLEGDDMALEISKRYPEVNPYVTTKKLMTQAQLKKIVKKDWDETLVIRPMKKSIEVQDDTTREVLGKLANYKNMIQSDN